MTDRDTVIKGIQECDLNGGLIGNCPYKGILVLLKDQEPAMPTWRQGKACCGKCGQRLPRKMADREINYCGYCGQAVKWE
jgi:hypothetical protein